MCVIRAKRENVIALSVWPQLDNFQWVYMQKARKESALVRNMELDVTNKGLD